MKVPRRGEAIEHTDFARVVGELLFPPVLHGGSLASGATAKMQLRAIKHSKTMPTDFVSGRRFMYRDSFYCSKKSKQMLNLLGQD